jgi:protein-S-isoprenylcysteine O-methyltransferase Ste14
MKNILKQLFSFILPVTVLIIVPMAIEKNRSVTDIRQALEGFVFVCIGLWMMIVTIHSFIGKGKGTLAPWSPTSKLITTGLYAYVRSPMIIGVILVLLGESLIFLSFNIFGWALAFFIINNIWFAVYKEPDLQKKFGEEYKEYKKQVHRWIPRLHTYNSGRNSQK